MTKGTLSGVAGVSNNNIASLMSAKNSSGALSVSGGTVGGRSVADRATRLLVDDLDPDQALAEGLAARALQQDGLGQGNHNREQPDDEPQDRAVAAPRGARL